MSPQKLTFLTVMLCIGTALGQGALTPPGAPGKTMKTLDQVEARTPISMPEFVIDKPGSYYLSTNLILSAGVDGISITTNNVTLDLNGFSILGQNVAKTGILIAHGGFLARDNVRIFNGTIRGINGWAIQAEEAIQCQFEDLKLIENGRDYSGHGAIISGSDTLVRNCWFEQGGIGLEVGRKSKVLDNYIFDNHSTGLRLSGTDSYIANNYIKGNATNYNLSAGNQLNILLCEVPITLNWPCSVKLQGSLTCTDVSTNGITVLADDVSIDLCGHALNGTPGSKCGIYQPKTYRNLRVHNGKMDIWNGYEIYAIYAAGDNSQLDNLQMKGCSQSIYTGNNCSISDCSIYGDWGSGGYGIFVKGVCRISNCSSSYNGIDGIHIESYSGIGSTILNSHCFYNKNDGINVSECCAITGSTASFNGNRGIYAEISCKIENCIAKNNGGDGLRLSEEGIVSGSVASHNTGNGIGMYNNCVAINNNSTANGDSGNYNYSAGIYVKGHGNRIDSNTFTGNATGILVENAGNFIVRNTAQWNSPNYNITGTQTIGPIITTTGTITNQNPWANFSF